MSNFAFRPVITAIAAKLKPIKKIHRVQDVDQITESIPPADLPLLMIYPNSISGDTLGSTQMSTFGGSANQIPVVVEDAIITCDIYIAQVGANLAESIKDLTEVFDDVLEVVRAETTQPYWGSDLIKSYQWDMERGIIEYAKVSYFTITLTLTIREF